MDVYVVRHGESEANLGKYHSGWAKVNLTEQGKKDAEMAGRILAGITFDRIYASDLPRAVQTAQIALPGCEPVQLEMLREINTGTLTFKYVDECYATLGETYRRARACRDFTPYEGENHAMHCKRAADFLDMLSETAAEGEKVAVFSHFGTIQCMLDKVLRADTSSGNVSVRNGSVTHFRWTGEKWVLVEWNRTE